jgi:ABC-2 type transport system permease protein
MTRLLKIEWLKLKHYKAFWILSGMYALGVILVCSGGMFLMEFLKSKGADFEGLDPTMLPLYDFPDIWQNITYIASFFKIILAFIIIISISNEASFRTLRQNIIDGLSNKEFLMSKLALILALSIFTSVLLFTIGLITGSAYSHVWGLSYIFQSTQFLFAYALEVFSYLTFALMVVLFIRKTGMVIVGLFMYTLMFEPLFIVFLENYPEMPEFIKGIGPFFPIAALNNLIHVPFQRYIFMEIQDYVSWKETLIVIGWMIFNITMCYQILKRKDL